MYCIVMVYGVIDMINTKCSNKRIIHVLLSCTYTCISKYSAAASSNTIKRGSLVWSYSFKPIYNVFGWVGSLILIGVKGEAGNQIETKRNMLVIH